ncbi:MULTISPECIES: GNAT family N-acetyltransferase [unclassified Enterococcus]|uniref:GNAT family N-acetyltransferase n=1 Tax=unclassified Enterococcus TaxID=2608891 RepID=UPI00155447BE|nr:MULTISPECIES: GNAT family N-acetyltransferase [unclassified Enterococcus]MBS7576588.1 GNAT family N-acetyltransferase [Enterococcus sp. MMGLQ5-2]MBS7583925.1 GNAT family N-acetyltransferase [Enterococcus sp. MMGLQ5-1]NPD11786.1 GNAT family N-acetyltransferase [Enterococcus sp. MMGLQ5-1]NPD36425.1 GNAT family N-acetyltransferase [Enterococcus sp. MMGLQ5-2]
MSVDKELTFVIEDSKIDYQQVKNLLHHYGLTDLPAEKIELAFKNSLYQVFVLDADSLVVGCGRAISDGVSHAEIYNIALLEKYQHKGIGQQIIQNLIKQAHGQIITLYTAPWSVDWYIKQGFRRLNTGLIRFRAHEIEWMTEKKFIE